MTKTKPEVKIKEKLELMVVNKCPLKNVIKNIQLQKDINEMCIKINKIIIQTYQFLKLYILSKYDNNNTIPKINKNFIMNIIKVITKRHDTRGKPSKNETKNVLNELTLFYKNDYKKCISDNDVIDSTKLNFVLAYEAIDVVKNIETHISEHFIDFVNKFVNVTFNIKEQLDEINKLKISKDEKKEKRKELNMKHRSVKDDLLKLNNSYESDKILFKKVNLRKIPFIMM
jgi:hypothetical protein